MFLIEDKIVCINCVPHFEVHLHCEMTKYRYLAYSLLHRAIFLMRTLNIHSVSIFKDYNISLLTTVIMLYNRSYSFYN